jgi:hypothetical protein
LKKIVKTKSMGLNFRFCYLTSTATPFKHYELVEMEINGIPLKVKMKELVIKWLSISSK